MKKIFSATLVITLLLIYTGVLGLILIRLFTADEYSSPSGIVVSTITTIGGLISALVVAKLAIAEPGTIPSLTGSEKATDIEKWITGLYFGFWGLVGLGCFVIGTFIEDKEPLVNEIGTTWFGIAVAAAYAYLGINPSSK